MSTSLQLIKHIERFILLQVTLITAFRKIYPSLKDWNNMLDFPRKGELETSEGIWHFHLHGCGLVFIDSDGTTIDSHDMVPDSEIIDAWRLLQYLESINIVKEDELSISDVEDALKQLAHDGALILVNQERRKYKLSR